MSHHCQFLVFRCLDFRIKPGVLCRLLEKELDCCEGEYDLVSVAGSAKDLLGQEGEKNFLLKQIVLSKKLHQIEKVVVLYHDNCGAYGIADPKLESETQKNDLAKIQAIIAEQFPDLQFMAFIIKGVPIDILSLEKVI